ncbi:hypothetical protein QJQ45_003603 [Haematococcus lacustris]|nr:hypothetical protein QJQ45_003603 [Haematococcus lacustris]
MAPTAWIAETSSVPLPLAIADQAGDFRLAPRFSQARLFALAVWFSRVMSRSEELSNWFGIPGTEGRMYVFDHYLCFHSNVFGFSKKKVINFEDVVGVRKKSHFRFPNSIEVRTFLAAFADAITTVAAASASAVEVQRSDGRTAREFFTSFLSREDAFRIIMQCWSHAKGLVMYDSRAACALTLLPKAMRLVACQESEGPGSGRVGDAPGSDTLPYADPALIDGQSSLSGKPPLPSRSSGNSNMFGTLLSGMVGPSNKGNGGRASTAPIEEESMTSFDEALSVGAGASKEGKPAESGMFLSSLNSLTKGISKHARARSSPLIGPGPASTPTSASATAAMPSPSFFNTMAAGLGMGRPAAATTPTSSFAPPDASSSPLTAAGSGGGRRTGSGGEGGGGEGGQPISPTRRPTRIPPPAPSSSQSRPRIPSYPWQGLPGAGVPVPAPPCLSPRTQSQSQGGICSTGPGLPLDAPAAGVGGLLQVSGPNGTVSKELVRAQAESCAQGRASPAMPTLQEMGSGEGGVARGVGAGSASAGGAAVRQSSSASALVADLRRSVSAAAEAQAGDAQAVVSEVVVGTPEDVFAVLLANDSHFLEDFLEAQGNRRINIKAWQRHEQLGHVRDIQFVAPIKGAFASWGVPHAQCYQSHRFCNYAGGHMVFETSQTMANIPYGDCFTVDVRLGVGPDRMRSTFARVAVVDSQTGSPLG